MTSVFRAALGADFHRLHPMMQRRFDVGLDAAEACIGRGVMTSIRRGPWWTVPFLQIGRLRNILVPDVGDDVPFTIENYPYRDAHGRETVTFVRTYTTRPGRTARFDATMVLVGGRVLDYLGSHQHLAVDLDLVVDDRGGLVLTSDAQRFYEGPIAFRFPMLFSGRATLHEYWSDEDESFHVDLEVRNALFGFLFGYRGTFTCEWVPATDAPDRLKPRRTELRT
ncbi:DUF4166 domain-containing protein [Curtobacterium sp. MCLR17_043]|jgi:hypothetical protein|uniref:DUF4166 domain-containing protein n=1 Tax=Curtobacterium TaxID=2034 RepID=UPI000D9EC1C5|nr:MULTISPECIES: DUF4166 domain-containing protein [Curtobacterium]MBF4627332.1 DUF4166 domain-containing protein [Curtobacterium flaccumfaciens]PYY46302.1 DUF4166 domain-containing protein [Curtobacterium sp. MCLR17_043]PZE31478.1 DUF4166 domain-containing protein [Curtobacterium sp. MCLR17_055]PZF01003.1 DUF4166 domain-containing protein [Curtobacterium sp. MCLR17_040]WIE82557.1 DUF4166 domain-containing protein [Curtobacterium sp. MCPF17_021]